jgi:hypothetical protein
MVQKWISAIVPLTPEQDQRNYLRYGMIQSLGLNNALFTMRVSLRIQPVAGQPGTRIALVLRHALIFLLRFRNERGRRLFITYQNSIVVRGL